MTFIPPAQSNRYGFPAAGASRRARESVRPGSVYSKAGFMKIFYFGVFLRFLLYNPLKTW